MRIKEIASILPKAPVKQTPLVLTPKQQARAVALARRQKILNLIANRQAKERSAAASKVTKGDIEASVVAAAYH